MIRETPAYDSKGVRVFKGAKVRIRNPSCLPDEEVSGRAGQTVEVKGLKQFRKLGTEKETWKEPRSFVAAYAGASALELNFGKPLFVVETGIKNSGVEVLNPGLLKETEDRNKDEQMAKKNDGKATKTERKISGRTTGLGVDKTFEFAFARATKEKHDLAWFERFVRSEFPDRPRFKKEGFGRPLVKAYNDGKLKGQEKKPSQPFPVPPRKNAKAPAAPAKKKVVVKRKALASAAK